METTQPDQQYLDRAMALDNEETQALAAKFDARFQKNPGVSHLAMLERAALQLHFEDDVLEEWRSNIEKLYQQHAS
ncbi:hypothetical protein [Thauera sinica]|uniref:Uncharacterized protein n=1 Tax=Thauera sinica TaxID=2665146 RepID=A0ABW1AMZ6_9RHOO|nr:hypothetical protein [Thauera sp. K11]